MCRPEAHVGWVGKEKVKDSIFRRQFCKAILGTREDNRTTVEEAEAAEAAAVSADAAKTLSLSQPFHLNSALK